MTTNFAAAATVVDRLLTEHGIDQDDVLSVDLYYSYGKEVDYKRTLTARVHTRGPLPGIDYTPKPASPHHMDATVTREELRIELTWISAQEAAA